MSPIKAMARAGQRLLGEARTRILLLYIGAMVLAIAGAVPLFRALLFQAVDRRVQADLTQEVEAFRAAHARWGTATDADLDVFIQSFLGARLPQDDNFHLIFLGGELVGTNPAVLPAVLRPDSALVGQWKQLQTAEMGRVAIADPAVGSVLYVSEVLAVNGAPRGLFVAAHLSAGERAEALVGVYLFAKVATGVVVLAFAMAWLSSHQLFKPVQQLAHTARAIDGTDLSQRLAVVGSGELADLASAFNAMMNRVQAAFEHQRNFINDAGHELFTPLTIIQGHLEVMGDAPAERAATLALVMDELDRMARFVNDLLLLAQADQPDFLQLETIPVAEFTESVFAKVSVLADRRWCLGSLGKGVLVGDRQRLAGALINLAKNAAQHTQPTDTIELGSATLGGQVRFWVRDTGEGIGASDQARIFDRFARAARSYRKSEGAGLGLAIVKAIAESHSGTVELVSQRGQGSTFTLVIPLDLQTMERAA